MTVCLLITTWNRSEQLRRSLERLSTLTLPDEVLIVDDGSDDGCERVCESLEDRLPIRYLYNHQPFQAMCAHARNVGLKNTTCDLILTSEPEMRFETDIVAQFLAKHAEHSTAMLNAGTIHHEHPDWDPPQTTTTLNWEATWVAMYPREALLGVGGWDESYPDPWGWDDVDLVTRLGAYGCANIKMPECEATHQWHPPTHMDQSKNEAYFKAKMDANGCMMITANQGRDWGVQKHR